MKKGFVLFLTLSLIFAFCVPIFAENETNNRAEYNLNTSNDIAISSKSAILIDAETGTVLYEKNADTQLSPASVTKVMTLLLVCEALKGGEFKLEDNVTISEYAASMGGSQIFLKEGESMSVSDLLKSTVIASANDAAVALAELVCGSESLFVSKMNTKAEQMKLNGCHFENVTGLDDSVTNHVMSARDIAKISAELIKYPEITEYASIWQDTIRDGQFTLTNTNRLVRYYDGCNGLKTGSTDKAGYCVSAAAKRGNMQLISVIMGADTKDTRNTEAKSLLDYGFANFALYESPECELEAVSVKGGKCTEIMVKKGDFVRIVKKADLKKVECIYEIPEFIKAPAECGDSIGKVVYKVDGITVGECSIFTPEAIEKLDFLTLFVTFIKSVFIG